MWFGEISLTVDHYPQDLPEYEVLGRRKSIYKNSIKIKCQDQKCSRLQVPDLNVEDVGSKNLQRQETVETLFENRDEPVTYGTMMTEELAEVSEGRSLADSDTPSEAPPGVGGRVPGCA